MQDAVQLAPDNCNSWYVICVKQGTYKENVEMGKKKNIMIVGDGLDSTISVIDGSTTLNSATFGT